MKLEDFDDDHCPWCDAPLPDTRRAGTIYCSKLCAQKHYAALDKQGRREARAGRLCEECHGPIDDRKPARTIYCSKACARMAMRKRTWGYRTCRVCDTRFLAAHKNQFMCVPPHRFMECVERLRASRG